MTPSQHEAYRLAGLVHTPGVGWHAPPAPINGYVPVPRESRVGLCPAHIELRRP